MQGHLCEGWHLGHHGELLQELLTDCCFWENVASRSSSLTGACFEFSPTSAPHLIIIKPYLLQQQGSLGGRLRSDGKGGGEST